MAAMGGKRRRGEKIASPNQLQPERVTDFLWGLAVTAPEHPLVLRDDGPMGSALGGDTPRCEPAPGEAVTSTSPALDEDADPPLPPTIYSTMFPKRGSSPPPGWPATDTTRGAQTAVSPPPELVRPALIDARPLLDGVLTPDADPVREEAAWWARHGRRMRPIPAGRAPQLEAACVIESVAPGSSAASQLVTADVRREAGDLDGAAQAIAAALASELDIPGGTERHQSLGPVIERARQLVSPIAREPRQTSPEERAMLERFRQRWRAGERLAAVLELRAFTRTAAASGLAVERLLEAERALSLGRRERLRWGDDDVVIVFGTTAWLGRSDADIDVPSPLISRQHLLFTATDTGPVARDHASANGTFIEQHGPRLELHIEKRCELRLGGDIEVCVEPLGEAGRHLRVRTALGITLLALGERLELDGVVLQRWQSDGLAGWQLQPSLHAASRALARGDRFPFGGLELRL
jgi:hypothetical protein